MENALCRKSNFDIKLTCNTNLPSPMMLKFGVEIALGMIQKSDVAIFEILIFWHFSGVQSPKMANLDQNLDLDPLKNCEKSKFNFVFSLLRKSVTEHLLILTPTK